MSVILRIFYRCLLLLDRLLSFDELPDRYLELFPQPISIPFHLFQKLPIDIRFMIWKEALPVGVKVQFHVSMRASDVRIPPTIPAVLHVCQESRAATLSSFVRVQRWKYGGQGQLSSHFYFNPERDVLELDMGSLGYTMLDKFLEQLGSSEVKPLNKVRRIRIYGALWNVAVQMLLRDQKLVVQFPDGSLQETSLPAIFKHFKNLRWLDVSPSRKTWMGRWQGEVVAENVMHKGWFGVKSSDTQEIIQRNKGKQKRLYEALVAHFELLQEKFGPREIPKIQIYNEVGFGGGAGVSWRDY